MNRLTTITLKQLDDWIAQARQYAKRGQLPNYIPLLHQANSSNLAIAIATSENQRLSAGEREITFPLMSVIKPFTLLYLLTYLGSETVFKRVGRESSSYPFNSLEQLQSDRGFPRNPMINSGAITLSSLIPGNDGRSRCEKLRLWLNQSASCQLFLSEPMLQSVRSLANPRNQALAQELALKGSLENPELALDTYNHLCCLSGTITDLARLGLLLVKCPSCLILEHCQTVLEIMTTCGLYEASESFAQRVGLPTKSGVSGAVLSIVPGQGAIACYSPPLNYQGNSVAGLFLIEQIVFHKQ